MKFLIILFLSLSLITSQANAGFTSKAIKTGALYYAFKIGATKGKPIAKKAAVGAIKRYVKKNPENIAAITAMLTGFAIENSNFTNNATDIMLNSGLIDKKRSNEIVEESQEYEKAEAIVIEHLKNEKSPQNCTTNDLQKLSKYEINDFMIKASNPVQINDVGSYRDLQRREVVYDGLEHDHIPSFAAIMKHMSINFNTFYKKDSASYNLIKNNTTTIEVTKQLHSEGRTYRRKNSPSQIKSDAKNLKMATIKDFSYHLMNSEFDFSMLTSFTDVYRRNAALCLYR